MSLELAVPLRIEELRSLSENERLSLAAQASEEIASHGDMILHLGTRAGETAAAFNWLVTGLACAAFAPGGVRFRQLGWCAAHPHSRAGRRDGICSACLAAETEPPEPGMQ